MNASSIRIRVYYEDTDWGGVVYYANYLRYAEAGRTEYLRERGVHLAELQTQGIMFVVVDVRARYLAPARYDDLLDVRTELAECSALTLTFETRVFNHKGQHLTTIRVKLACIDGSGRIERIPRPVLERIGATITDASGSSDRDTRP